MEIKIKGHFYENGGYAKVNRNLALGLKSLGIKVNIDPIGRIGKNKLNFPHKKIGKDIICIDSIVPTDGAESYGKYRILYTTIESYTLSSSFIDFVKKYHEIWVTSNFCKEILNKYKIKNIYVIPDSIDCNIYNVNNDKYNFGYNLKSFIFVSVFGWSYRKGYDVLLKSYLKEFSNNDDVSLLIMSKYNYREQNKNIIKKEIDKFIKRYGGENPPQIIRMSKNIDEEEMPKIYRACNVFCLFSRGEGFQLPACEASLCGLPVISTNCSGHTMFLNKNNSYLLDIDKLEKIKPGMMQFNYWDNLEMASLTDKNLIKKAGKLMREVFNNYKKAKTKNNKLKKYIMSNYNINSVSLLVKKRLEEIEEKIK